MKSPKRRTAGLRGVATRLGITLDELLARRRDGERHCPQCKQWALIGQFIGGWCRSCCAGRDRDDYVAARASGRCTWCSAMARPGRSMCEMHAAQHSARVASDRKAKREREDRV